MTGRVGTAKKPKRVSEIFSKGDALFRFRRGGKMYFNIY